MATLLFLDAIKSKSSSEFVGAVRYCLSASTMTVPMEQSERPWFRWLRDSDLAAPVGLLLFLLATITAVGGLRTWDELNDREPLLAGLPASGARQLSAPPARVARRIVMIIADGLNADRSSQLASLKMIHQRGVRARGMAAGPTLSTPSYVTWMTGLDPVDSGVRTNRYRISFPLDSVIRRAHEAGLQTMTYESGDRPLLPVLFGPSISRHLQGAAAWVQVLAGVEGADLAILALAECDHAGHLYGAQHPRYGHAVTQLEQKIQQVLGLLDLKRDLLVVVNDHGHLPGGGHGGKEEAARRLFLVMAGPGIIHQSGEGRMDQKDLAPTLALLLGLPPPAHNRGWPLEWAIDPALGVQYHRARFLAQFKTRLRVERYLSQELLGGVEMRAGRSFAEDISRASLGNLDEARRLGRGRIYALQRQVDRARLDYLKSLRILRGTIWITTLALFALGLYISCKMRILRVGVMSLLTMVSMMATATWLIDLQGVRASLSYSGGVGETALKVALAVGGTALLQLSLIWLMSRGARDGRDGLTGGVLASVWLSAVPAAAGYSMIASAAGAALPDLKVLAVTLLVGFGLTIYLATAGLVLVVIGLARRIHRRSSGPEFNV